MENSYYNCDEEEIMTDKSRTIKKFGEREIENQFIYRECDKIGNGLYGGIYYGYNKETKEAFAFKEESTNVRIPKLEHEFNILKNLQDIEGFPKIYKLSLLEDRIVLIMELLGYNLNQIMYKVRNKHFSIKTVIMLGIQMLKRIRDLHEKNYIHGDISPKHFTIGFENNNIYMIDFSQAKNYCDKDKKHITYNDRKIITGNQIFTSIYTQSGIEQSRRDDLESLGYMLIYFYTGTLPWMNIKAKNKEIKFNRIKEKKIEVTPDILCQGLDKMFLDYLIYVRNLGFDENPNYSLILNLFFNSMKKYGFKNDLIFDWNIEANTMKSSSYNPSKSMLISKISVSK